MALYCLSGSCFLQNRLKIRLGENKKFDSPHILVHDLINFCRFIITHCKKNLSSSFDSVDLFYPLSITYSQTHSKRYIIYLFMKWDGLIPIEVLFNLNSNTIVHAWMSFPVAQHTNACHGFYIP